MINEPADVHGDSHTAARDGILPGRYEHHIVEPGATKTRILRLEENYTYRLTYSVQVTGIPPIWIADPDAPPWDIPAPPRIESSGLWSVDRATLPWRVTLANGDRTVMTLAYKGNTLTSEDSGDVWTRTGSSTWPLPPIII